MDLQQRTKRFGWYMILLACVLRLTLAGIPQMLLRQLQDLKTAFPIYSETGRDVRFLSSFEKAWDHFRESPPPDIPQAQKLRFSGDDADLIQMDYDCALRPDLGALLEQPLDWSLQGKLPTVLILHTHTTESYTKAGETYAETAGFRTLDERYNMLCVGEAVAGILEENGIGVIHDRQVHDYPSYNGSYIHARSSTEELLERYPSVELVLDLHRDALEKNGKQIPVTAQKDGEVLAQLMFVVGTDISRQSHRHWEENLSLALKLQLLLERQCPGIMRPVNLREQRFNQDLHPHALLVEVGTAGNTRAEALAAARQLAVAVVMLQNGTYQEPSAADPRGWRVPAPVEPVHE